ncbi:MAG: hypothetical protein AAFU80_08810 [Pseudomonadota bacterium]
MRATAFFLVLLIIPVNTVFAQGEETLRLRYGDTTELQLGVGVDEAEPSKARQFCLEFEPTDIYFDVGGATSAELSTRGVFDVRDFVNDFKFSYSVDTTASAGVGKLFSASSTIKNAGKFELFLKNYNAGFSVTIDALARHGSERLRYNGGLKSEFQKLIDEKEFGQFRQKCGTHFIASRSLVSQISVVINAKDVSSTLKNTISQTWDANFQAKGSFEGLSAEAKASTSTSLSNALALTQRHGTITHDVRSRGGAGIASVSKVLEGITYKPDEIDKVFSSIATAAADFTKEKAAPEEFNLISYEIFGAQPPSLPPDTFENLNKIYKRIVRIDAAIGIYEGYKTDRPTIYAKYFKPIHDALLTLRTSAVAVYRSCRSGDNCTLPSMPELRSIVFLEDILSRAEFGVQCVHGHSVADVQGKAENYLSSADMVVTGDIQFLSELDLQSTRVFRNASSDEIIDVKFDPKGRLRTWSPRGDSARFLIQLDTVQIPIEDITSESGYPDLGKMSDLRVSLREIAYIVEFGFKNGLTVEEVFAIPDLTECPVSLEN